MTRSSHVARHFIAVGFVGLTMAVAPAVLAQQAPLVDEVPSVGSILQRLDAYQDRVGSQPFVRDSETGESLVKPGSDPLYEFAVPINFQLNSSDIQPQYDDDLARLGEVLRQRPHVALIIVGHTDVTGGDRINMPLSNQRAASVVRRLNQSHGIEPQRLRARGMGSSSLLVPQDPASPRNRRVEFQFVRG